MYRIAVIQNEVEMQHSGYVDSVPKYRKQDFDLHEHVVNRFSSVNIGELFTEGENYLLDYDCVIIGTNATSDGDVYNILCNEENKLILEKFISMGKGVLICSQKKLQEDPDADESEYRARKHIFFQNRMNIRLYQDLLKKVLMRGILQFSIKNQIVFRSSCVLFLK